MRRLIIIGAALLLAGATGTAQAQGNRDEYTAETIRQVQRHDYSYEVQQNGQITPRYDAGYGRPRYARIAVPSYVTEATPPRRILRRFRSVTRSVVVHAPKAVSVVHAPKAVSLRAVRRARPVIVARRRPVLREEVEAARPVAAAVAPARVIGGGGVSGGTFAGGPQTGGGQSFSAGPSTGGGQVGATFARPGGIGVGGGGRR